MPSPADLIALVLTMAAPGQAAQTGTPAGEGPRASSNEGERYDAVGYAGAADIAAGVTHPSLPDGSYVEVTALDSGRTALFAVQGRSAVKVGEPVALSADAMRQLGLAAAGAPVRVRVARPLPPDIAALRAGRPAGSRLDAPPVLLVGLRQQLPPLQATPARVESSVAEPKPAAAPRPPALRPADPPKRPGAAAPPAATPISGWGVQIAALSDESRAKALAAQLGGRARSAGNLWRVQLGPFADRARAEAARANVARRGHPGAALVRIP